MRKIHATEHQDNIPISLFLASDTQVLALSNPFWPLLKSLIVFSTSSFVFMTNGPHCETGSPIGFPAMSTKRDFWLDLLENDTASPWLLSNTTVEWFATGLSFGPVGRGKVDIDSHIAVHTVNSVWFITRVRNWVVRVREFAVVIPLTLPCSGRVEEWNQLIFTNPNYPFSDSGDKSGAR